MIVSNRAPWNKTSLNLNYLFIDRLADLFTSDLKGSLSYFDPNIQ